MSDAALAPLLNLPSFRSSLREDAWHAQPEEKAYEWWHFDALSDDGREAVVIEFSDNYIFSPRYSMSEQKVVSDDAGALSATAKRFPAVSFLYSVDGKAVFQTISEFSERQFHASSERAECSIGESSFHLDSATYGSGYLVTVDVPLGPNRRLKGTFEWLSIECDLLPDDTGGRSGISWNMVAPRSDVTGRIELVDRVGKSKQLFHFRGTGYHDHIIGARSIDEVIKCRQWGRAHFIDTTAVFCIQNTVDAAEPSAALMLVRDGKIHQRIARCEQQQFRRDKFGIKYPARLTFVTEDNIRLRVKNTEVIESSFFELRFTSEMTLMLRDGKPRKTIGLSEFIAPKNIRYRLFRWFADLQIGKNGKGPIL